MSVRLTVLNPRCLPLRAFAPLREIFLRIFLRVLRLFAAIPDFPTVGLASEAALHGCRGFAALLPFTFHLSPFTVFPLRLCVRFFLRVHSRSRLTDLTDMKDFFVQTTLRINDRVYRQAKAEAARVGITLTEFIERALESEIQRSANLSHEKDIQERNELMEALLRRTAGFRVGRKPTRQEMNAR